MAPRDLSAKISSSGASRVVVPYELDSEMVDWAIRNVPRLGTELQRLVILADRLLAKDGLDIRYSRDATGTAREVFEQRRANCLAFTHLFVGMARTLGIGVDFLEVRDLDRYRREDDLVVHSDHIAVGFGPHHQRTIIDFAGEPGMQYRQIRLLSDGEATALYYSNRGADDLRAGDVVGALSWLRDAVLVSPEVAGAWVNLGVALRRSGDLDAAEDAYRRALVVDSTEFSAYQNLATLLNIKGREKEAYELLELTDGAKNRNPYTFLALGDLSTRSGRLEDAERFYRKAVRVNQDDPEPLAAMGTLALANGDVVGARKWLRKARRLDPDGHRVQALAARIEVVVSSRQDPSPHTS